MRWFSQFSKASAPVKIGGQAAAVPDSGVAAETAQIVTLHPKAALVSVPEPIAPEDAIITSLKEIPGYEHILTANVGRNPIRLEKAMQFAVMVLEIGAKRAAIYFNPGAPSKATRDTLTQVRVRLIADGYEVEPTERRCSEEVIRKCLEDYESRSENSEVSSVSSESRQMWELWSELAWRERASDLHISWVGNKAFIQIRVDGTLEPLPCDHEGVYTATQAEQVVAWAFGDSTQTDSNNASMFSPKNNIYSMFKPRVIDGMKIGMRFQSLAGHTGPKVVCRLLNIDVDAPTLSYAQLGYAESHQELFQEAAENPTGLILITGITGSGKTTTGKTFVEDHPDNGSAAFYSIEDPIEYTLRGTHQIPVQRDLSDPEASAKLYNEIVSGIVRADPDGVLMGEIRDKASAGAAQQFVETGHWAIGTLHAHLLSGIIPRLVDESIGVSREVITGPNILSLLVYQGLVPLLCPHCCINGVNEPEFRNIHFGQPRGKVGPKVKGIVELLALLNAKFQLPSELFNFRRKGGCAHCSKRGTKGVTVVAEMMMPDEKWLELIRSNKDHEAVEHYRSFSDCDFRSPDMTGKTVFEHTLYKATLGIVDPRRCQSFDRFRRFKVLKKAEQ